MKILIAEDDYTSRKILASILKKWNFDPVVAEDGKAAWDTLQQPDAPTLVLLDWNMPGMDGLEVCRRLRANDSSNPPYVILLTGRGEKDDIVHGLEAGANDYISKPYDNQELQARIRVGIRMLELQTGLVEARDALAYQAMHDPLTGIYSRRAILDKLAGELARAQRENGSLSVGMCDLDHFKHVNDTYGHQAGDDVLIAFARCVQSNLREYDSIGRFGGEEFIVVTPGNTDEGLYERLRSQVACNQIRTGKGVLTISVSIGVASGTGQASVGEFIALADEALYRAKTGGRNRVVYETLKPVSVPTF